MTNMVKSPLILMTYVIVQVVIIACSASKTEKVDRCETAVQLQKMDLDGCEWLLITEQGEKWLARNINEAPFSLADEKQLRITATILPDMASICMAEDHVVEVTCWEELP